MRLKPLNRTLIIEPDADYIPVDLADPRIEEVVKRGLILLPEKNTLMKLSNQAKVIRAANDCWYPFKKNQRIIYNQFFDEPFWYDCPEDKKRYRIIKEWYVQLIYEDH